MTDTQSRLGDDLLVGAEAISSWLNAGSPDGNWNRRRVYHLAEQGNMPIHRVKGLGIVARKSALTAYFDNLDSNTNSQLASGLCVNDQQEKWQA